VDKRTVTRHAGTAVMSVTAIALIIRGMRPAILTQTFCALPQADGSLSRLISQFCSPLSTLRVKSSLSGP
jgi:hypothetical protein